jgi:hypothetical protein
VLLLLKLATSAVGCSRGALAGAWRQEKFGGSLRRFIIDVSRWQLAVRHLTFDQLRQLQDPYLPITAHAACAPRWSYMCSG